MSSATVNVSSAEEALNEEELRALRGFMRAYGALKRKLDATLERTHGMPIVSYEVLRYLEEADDGRMRMSDLADRAQLSRSGLTRLVDRLEREGLLERCSCKHDARGAYACLTGEGRLRLAAARETHRGLVRELFLSRFSEEELSALADMCDRIAPCSGC
jgi:DNA-binding MarR family transcriptional regulator